MDQVATPAPGGEGAPAPIVSTPAVDTTPISTREAGRALAERRWKKTREPEAPVETPQAAPVEQTELAETPTDDRPEAAPVETTEQQPEPAEELPPIEPPRSWTSEEKDRFKSYPRELQAYLSEREQQRDRDFRTRQNEAAERLKVLTAKEQEAEKARQEYAAALPAVMQTLQDAQAGQYGDIKTQADIDKMASEDPFRFIQWQAHQQKVSALHRELQTAQERQAKEWEAKWSEFAAREDKLVGERIPELADPAQRSKVQEAALSYLKDIGFQDSELGSAWNGQASLSLRDHRLQVLIRDAVKGREIQAAAKKARPVEKPLPPVQRAGVAAPKGAANDQHLKTLSAKLDQTGSAKDAAKLLAARRAART